MNADSIKIECEEDGFWLVIEANVPTIRWNENAVARVRFRITDPEALYDHVKAVIGSWLYERDVAHLEVETGKADIGFIRPAPDPENKFELFREVFACDPDESGGYDASDFYSIHADIWDNREGK